MTEGCAVLPLVEGNRVEPQVDGGERGNLRDLAALAAAGQPAAIESLLRQIRPMVVRYCRARLGRIAGQYHVADDVAQEVCIAVLSALPRYRDMGRPTGRGRRRPWWPTSRPSARWHC